MTSRQERKREANRRYYQANREAILEQKQGYTEANRGAKAQYDRRRYDTARAEVLAHYSPSSPPRCACCGTTRKLTIDHVNGGGTAHRREIFGRPQSGWQFYLWLIAENFPPGYQVLCRPCNGSKHDGERCRLDHGEMLALVRELADAPGDTSAHDEDQGDETYACPACGAPVGMFTGLAGWQHFRGDGTADSPVELYDAGHEATLAHPGS